MYLNGVVFKISGVAVQSGLFHQRQLSGGADIVYTADKDNTPPPQHNST